MKYLKNIFEKIKTRMSWSAGGRIEKILRNLLVILAALAIAASMIGSGFYFGYSYGNNYPKNIIIKGVSDMESGSKTGADFSIFWQAWDLLKNNHIKGAELEDKNLIYGAIEGLVNSADDPHTVFMRPDDSQKFEEDIQGEFGGIGAELGLKDDFVVVVAPLEDTPASRAGIKAGDKILEVDGKPILKPDVTETVKKIRGTVGTQVMLKLLSNGDDSPHEVTLTRATFETPTVKWEIKDGDIAYIQLFSFNEKASYLFYKASLAVMLGDLKGIVLDLRNDPGGYLEVAVNISGWFFEKGTPVVSEKFRSGEETKFTANGTAAFKDLPIVVLVNKGSASASEILAGALRDNRKIKLIGEKTFGKGTVQNLEQLKDGSQIKMTIANWIMPSGKILDEKGLVPDIEVKITEKDVEVKEDPQLERALEELRKML